MWYVMYGIVQCVKLDHVVHTFCIAQGKVTLVESSGIVDISAILIAGNKSE